MVLQICSKILLDIAIFYHVAATTLLIFYSSAVFLIYLRDLRYLSAVVGRGDGLYEIPRPEQTGFFVSRSLTLPFAPP